MAKARKPRPTPSASAVPSSAESTLEERTQHLIQALGSEAGFLEQWIAHYLAELVETAENNKVAAQARSEAREEIARVLPALWEQQIARETAQVRAKVDHWLGQTGALTPDLERMLAPLLANPEKTVDLTEDEVWTMLRALHTLTELITRFLITTVTAERTKQDVTSEAIQRLFQGDLQRLQAAIARVIPDLAEVDPTDWGAVGTLGHQALLTVTRAQLSLLNRMAREDEE